jgi:hypothetical protein
LAVFMASSIPRRKLQINKTATPNASISGGVGETLLPSAKRRATPDLLSGNFVSWLS